MAVATFMLLMIILLAFSQMTMEISVYGFMVNQRNIEIANEIQESVIEENNRQEELQQINVQEETKAKTDVVKKTQQSVFLLAKPIKGGVTSSCFGEVVDRNGPHIGHDWAVDVGTKVRASGDGIVEKAYYSESYGYNILIDHKNGMKTRYAHLSELRVKKGQTVDKGDLIGFSGNTGDSTGPHLHFEVVINGSRVNPLNYLKQK